ncbi:MFS transporter [Stackebrandtia nassauensis]|uniref:Major facilitator superfamily MFS_1 n=1 Tax=Stackebrandtia nassauensis (strain DSM 44728 / CIP 108903 / NRRL B-16338 / NBRC 102104 / LLR-40K-21) TaxID=446470 RepID=D3Q6N5_STANL|nr:MFS transporter [Stackebrandtia nassauensis]ADD44278.1 major facilitator superfamily MFS_1 [Stackebrandtia nassauensis DSM 44728]
MTNDSRSEAAGERPATYREVFASAELTALFASFAVSKAGSMLARVAVTFLVYNNTNSPLLATGTFAITYAPYLGPAQLLAALADRMSYRTTMVVSDFLRMIFIGLVGVIAVLPIETAVALPFMLVLVFAAAMVEPAYQSARSAMMPRLVEGDALTLALSVYLTLNQSAQLAGYFLGGVIAAINPDIALFINAGAFALSGVVLLIFVKKRPPVTNGEPRENIFAETAAGFKLVFGNRILRIIALVVFTTIMFTIIPEGAAAPWAHEVGGTAVLQGVIMASAPIAAIVSSVVFTRFTPPNLRRKLIRPLVFLAPLALVPALFEPSGTMVVVIAVVCNLTMASLSPLNAIFVKAVPDGYRARAFSVMQSGMMLIQGIAVVSIGALTKLGLSVAHTVGAWGVAGTIVVGGLLVFWPASSEFDDAVAAASPPAEPAKQAGGA